MKIKARVGDIFQIPLGDDQVGFGQIVAKCNPICYMVAFDLVAHKDAPAVVEQILASPIIFLGNFFDSLIKIGEWKVIANAKPDLGKIPFPCYQVEIEGKVYVESWDAELRRPATLMEIELLDRPNNNGPAFLQDAVKAHFGKVPYDPECDKFRHDHVLARSTVTI